MFDKDKEKEEMLNTFPTEEEKNRAPEDARTNGADGQETVAENGTELNPEQGTAAEGNTESGADTAGLNPEEPGAADDTPADEVPKKKPRRQFSQKSKYRTTAAVFTALVVIIVVVINLLFYAVGQKVDTKIDLTQDRILDFSDQTLDVLNSLTEDVYVYSLIPDMNDEVLDSLDSILDRYQKLSSHIKYEKIDATKNPQFVQQYQRSGEQISQYSVIFECGEKFRVVDINDAIQMSSQTRMVQSLSAEQKFTSAISYVANESDVKVAITEGHGENGQEVFETMLVDENYDVEVLNLTTADIAEDVDMLLISSPQTDFTADEINKIDAFFDRGGKAQVFMDVSDASLPRLESYLQEWGVTFMPGFAADTNPNNYAQALNLLLPEIQSSEITEAILNNNLMMIVPQARGIELSEVVGVEREELLKTSQDSFVRVDPNAQDTSMIESDIKGPITLAARLTRSAENGTAQLFVMGNTVFANQSFTDQSAYANKDFYLNLSASMTEKQSSLSIRAKDISPSILSITFIQALVLSGIVLIVLPLIVLILGLTVWLRRRHL